MIALLYLIISVLSGYVICSYAFPRLKKMGMYSYGNKEINLHPYFILLPAYFLIGTIVQTWCVYLLAYIFQGKAHPLAYANAIIMPLFAILSFILCYKMNQKVIKAEHIIYSKVTTFEKIVIVAICILAYTLMWKTFYVKGETLYVGYTVFSDFSPHLGMIRSFSYGNNFPTQYPFFAGEDVKYHFMFQFLVGNLEFLGMRIDNAFNIPSALGFVSVVSLLYVFAYKLTAKKVVGYLTCLFFVFRSSNSVFKFMAEQPEGTNILKALKDNTEFISYSTHEDWGLWNLNVYCNQRHFAFSIAILLLIIIQFMPHLFEMTERIRSIIAEKKEITKVKSTSFIEDTLSDVEIFVKESLFSVKGWYVKDLRLAICSGVLLGALTFWNGASTIAALLILFAIAIAADRRLEFLIMAVVTVSLSMLQSALFVNGSAVSPTILFGFIAENKTFLGTMDYLFRLLGILPYVLIVAFLLVKGVKKYILIAFSFPLFFAFTVSLTSDVTVNHKYIMISVMLINIFAAIVIDKLISVRNIWYRITCIVMVVFLTATGVYDYTMVLKKNKNCVQYDLHDPLTEWIKENATSKDIFLTNNIVLNNIVLGGAMLFEGWQYFSWSAGYDTASRDALVTKMYEATSSTMLDKLIKENNIRFIVVDNDVRNSTSYIVNEEVISDTYQAVYFYNDNGSNTVIYDTNLLVR